MKTKQWRMNDICILITFSATSGLCKRGKNDILNSMNSCFFLSKRVSFIIHILCYVNRRATLSSLPDYEMVDGTCSLFDFKHSNVGFYGESMHWLALFRALLLFFFGHMFFQCMQQDSSLICVDAGKEENIVHFFVYQRLHVH